MNGKKQRATYGRHHQYIASAPDAPQSKEMSVTASIAVRPFSDEDTRDNRSAMKKAGIHQRRTRFIKEYLKDQNATRAAIAAGYSEKCAKVQGSRLLTDANIRSQIETANDQINKKLEVTVERVREELARLAFYDPSAFWNKDGSAKPITDIDPDTVRALAGFEMAELYEGNGDERSQVGYVKKFKLADKGLNLERLGRHLKMFTDKVEVSGMDTLADALAKARQRAG